MTESIAAVTFYVGAASIVFATIRIARSSLERQRRDRAGIVVLLFGFACLAISVITFVTGSRAVLPF